eukprot:3940611-Rhodomonas_salina.1
MCVVRYWHSAVRYLHSALCEMRDNNSRGSPAGRLRCSLGWASRRRQVPYKSTRNQTQTTAFAAIGLCQALQVYSKSEADNRFCFRLVPSALFELAVCAMHDAENP